MVNLQELPEISNKPLRSAPSNIYRKHSELNFSYKFLVFPWSILFTKPLFSESSCSNLDSHTSLWFGCLKISVEAWFNKGVVKIGKQPNHRLVWLSRVEYQLSNNRGLVKRIDHGTFSYISHNQDSQALKITLNGTLLKGLLTINGNFCQLTKNN